MKWAPVLRKAEVSKVKPIVEISYDCHQLIKALHHDTRWKSKEWSCFCRIIKMDWYYKLVDMKFPKQDNRWAHTEITEAGKTAFMEWVLTERPEEWHEWMVWMHSHHGMGTFWSWEDYDTKASFDDWVCNHFFSIVTSHKANKDNLDTFDGIGYRWALDVYRPMRLEFDLQFRIGPVEESVIGDTNAEFEALIAEYEANNSIEWDVAMYEQQKQESIEEIENATMDDQDKIVAIQELVNVDDDVLEDIQAQHSMTKDTLIQDVEKVYDELIEEKKKEYEKGLEDILEEQSKQWFLPEKISELAEAERYTYSGGSYNKKKANTQTVPTATSRNFRGGKRKKENARGIVGNVDANEADRAFEHQSFKNKTVFLLPDGSLEIRNNGWSEVVALGWEIYLNDYTEVYYRGYEPTTGLAYIESTYLNSPVSSWFFIECLIVEDPIEEHDDDDMSLEHNYNINDEVVIAWEKFTIIDLSEQDYTALLRDDHWAEFVVSIWDLK